MKETNIKTREERNFTKNLVGAYTYAHAASTDAKSHNF
jgi:hypothetical protein